MYRTLLLGDAGRSLSSPFRHFRSQRVRPSAGPMMNSATKQSTLPCPRGGLLRFARNDGLKALIPCLQMLLLRPASFTSTRDLLDAGDQFVDRLVHRHLFAHHPVHGLGPDVLVVQDRELPVLGEVERRGAARELSVDGFPVPVSLPERALLTCGRHREPAAECALDIGPDV